MSAIDIRKVIQEELNNIAPGPISQASTRRGSARSDHIDSMDFLNFVIAIHRRLGIDIPEIGLSETRHSTAPSRTSMRNFRHLRTQP
jgi:acyl carrier protein